MAEAPYLTHEERTAAEPRDEGLYTARISNITTVNSTVRTFRMDLVDRSRGLNFKPGQWLDVFVPGIDKAGGFTITSAPSHARGDPLSSLGANPWFELAIQKSPKNPPARWLWQPQELIKDREVNVRVGGSFTWPPPGIEESLRRRVLMIAGGVGINPIMAYLNAFDASSSWPETVTLLYGSKYCREVDESQSGADPILFHSNILSIASRARNNFRYHVFPTSVGLPSAFETSSTSANTQVSQRRITLEDVEDALGPEASRGSTVVYVCGPQKMTDYFVAAISSIQGMSQTRVLCEKWW